MLRGQFEKEQQTKLKLDDSSAAQDSQFCSHGTYRNSSSHFTPFTTFCTSRCPRTQTHNRFVTLRDVVRCDRCNHGVQQMAELSPSGCFIAFANRVDLPLVFFIQIFISAQKQMSLLIHKHLSFADYPSVHASRHKYRTYSCSHAHCSLKLKQKNEGQITISRQQPPQTSFSVGRCTCHG